LFFTSTPVNLSGKSEAILNGDLTIKEITRPVSLQVDYNGLSKSPWEQEVLVLAQNKNKPKRLGINLESRIENRRCISW